MYFIWQLLNITAIVIIAIYAIKFILNFKKQKVKSISYLAVTLGLLIVSNLIKEKDSKEVFVLNTISETISKQAPKIDKTINLIDALAFDINAQITCLVNDDEIIPMIGIPVFEGFIIGFDWELKNLTTKKVQKGKIECKVSGELDWKILGIPVYTQTKEFEGTFTIEE